MLARLRQTFTDDQVKERLTVRLDRPEARSLRVSRATDRKSIESLWGQIATSTPVAATDRRTIADEATLEAAANYGSNIENITGTVKIPVGVIGPLRVNGIHAGGDYFVPLATTEAALAAQSQAFPSIAGIGPRSTIRPSGRFRRRSFLSRKGEIKSSAWDTAGHRNPLD